MWMEDDGSQTDRCAAIIWLDFFIHLRLPPTPLHSPPATGAAMGQRLESWEEVEHTSATCESLTALACPHRPTEQVQAN